MARRATGYAASGRRPAARRVGWLRNNPYPDSAKQILTLPGPAYPATGLSGMEVARADCMRGT